MFSGGRAADHRDEHTAEAYLQDENEVLVTATSEVYRPSLLLLMALLGLYYRQSFTSSQHPVNAHVASSESASDDEEQLLDSHSSFSDPSIAITLLPKTPTVYESGNIQMTCLTSGHTPSSPPLVTFLLPDSLTGDQHSKIEMYQQRGSAVLMIEGAELGHAGEYRCQATSAEDGHSAVEAVTLTVKKAPHLSAPVLEAGHHKQDGAAQSHSQSESQLPDVQKHRQRVEYQQQQVEQFCTDYDEQRLLYTLPEHSCFDFYRHILMDQQSNTLFCFAPKTGCTNLKVLFYISQGKLPKTELDKSRDDVNQERLEELMSGSSFMNMENESRVSALKSSYKFVMWRNPLERLFSSFRSKVERFPLMGLKRNNPHYNFIRRGVFEYSHKDEYERWWNEGGKTPVNISFSDFIDYWLYWTDEMAEDEHFQTILYMCQPCRVRYNYYGNFKNFEEEARVLVRHVEGNPKYLRHGYYSNDTSTAHIMQRYFSELNYQQKRKTLFKLSRELDFYYRLFPEELNVHKTILQIDDDIPPLKVRRNIAMTVHDSNSPWKHNSSHSVADVDKSAPPEHALNKRDRILSYLEKRGMKERVKRPLSS